MAYTTTRDPRGRKMELRSGRPKSERTPLQHWLEQENASPLTQLTGPDVSEIVCSGDDQRRWPSGWWIIPAAVLALPIWGIILHEIFVD